MREENYEEEIEKLGKTAKELIEEEPEIVFKDRDCVRLRADLKALSNIVSGRFSPMKPEQRVDDRLSNYVVVPNKDKDRIDFIFYSDDFIRKVAPPVDEPITLRDIRDLVEYHEGNV